MRNHIKPLLVAFAGFIGVLIAAQALSSYLMLNRVNALLDQDVTQAVKLYYAVTDAKYHITQIQQFLTDSAATGEKDGVEDAGKHLALAKQSLDVIAQLDVKLAPEAQAIAAQSQTLYDTGVKMVAAYGQGREAGNQVMKAPGGFDAQTDAMTARLGEDEKAAAVRRKAAFAALDASVEQNLLIGLVLGTIIVVLTLTSTITLYRKIFGVLGGEPATAASLTERMAQGRLDESIRTQGLGPRSLLGSLHQMQQRWVTIARGLQDHTDSVSAATRQLSGSADQLAANSARQSDATSAIAADIEQMSVSVNAIADQAATASRQVQQTGEAAVASAALIENVASEINHVAGNVSESARQVGELDARAREIEGIVTVIREIADQTNLLALNAAIEAARAGESGRGFAVVADKVRKLAERTASSTASIAEMIDHVHSSTRSIVASIEQSVSRVESSVSLTQQANDSMLRIREVARAADREVSVINASLGETRNAAHDIAVRVEDVAQTAGTNSQLAQGLAQASAHLSQVADDVRADVAFFKLPA